ncbi:hypothetical protein [Treponema denticola]|uniref:hypothetical protein n=1 Tax=Treponema denticola TaxID=158 RepID=UPI0020A29213|nr:hypothetical protein [Treponema denticola]UTC82360.1 hypothetical protein HGJ18_03765 [Treponema denticola]
MEQRQNIFFIPLIISLIMFVFLFTALFGSQYYFAFKILLVSFICVCIWTILALKCLVQSYRAQNISRRTVLSLLVIICLSFYLIRTIWFSGYLSLFPVRNLLTDRAHSDTLFNASLAESFVTNGYPSIQLNDSSYTPYHWLSNFIISLLSRFLKLPSFLVYNYLYPIVFIPTFIFFFFSVLIDFRKFYAKRIILSFSDICLCFFSLAGLFPRRLGDLMGFWMESTYMSESYLISLLALLVVVKVILSLKNFGYCFYYIFSPIIIIILAGFKVSIGIYFAIGVSYFLFRKEPFDIKTWIKVLLYIFALFVSYFIFQKSNQPTKFYFLHFIRHYVSHDFYVYHYFLLLFPAIVVFLYRTKSVKLFSKDYLIQKNHILPELLVIISVIGIMPGLFLSIYGGSAGYFFLPAFFISVFCFLGFDIFTEITAVIKSTQRFKFIYVICAVCLFTTVIMDIQPIHLTYSFLSQKLAVSPKTYLKEKLKQNNIIQSIYLLTSELFSPAQENNNKFYKNLNEINKVTSKNKHEYCVYVENTSDILSLYSGKEGLLRKLSGYYIISAYVGLPTINSIYTSDGKYYRGDGEFLTDSFSTMTYGLNTVTKRDFFTFDEAYIQAKQLRKKFIVYLYDDTFKVIQVN